MTKYIVFLDIDGVFTSNRVQFASQNSSDIWNKFDPVAVEFMNKIDHKYKNVKFCLISTWKNGLKTDDIMTEHWMLTAFRNAGFTGNFTTPWKTNPDNFDKFPTRANEILDFNNTFYPNIEDFIIFDDNDYGFKRILGKSRLIRTDANNGLLFKHMKDANSMMGMWEEK